MKYQLITVNKKVRENKGIFNDILVSPNKIIFKGKSDIEIPRVDIVIVNNLTQFGKNEYRELKELIDKNKNYIYKVYLEKRFTNTYIVNLITDYEED